MNSSASLAACLNFPGFLCGSERRLKNDDSSGIGCCKDMQHGFRRVLTREHGAEGANGVRFERRPATFKLVDLLPKVG